MNRENLDKLISNYIANFDLINNDVNMEYYKWEAVKHFQDHWNIDAPDFAAMFREAIRLTYNLHTAAASGRWCGAERPRCGLSNSRH